MAEPWVVKSELTAAEATMDEVEVFTDAAEVYTDLSATNKAAALASRTTVSDAGKNVFNPLLLGAG